MWFENLPLESFTATISRGSAWNMTIMRVSGHQSQAYDPKTAHAVATTLVKKVNAHELHGPQPCARPGSLSEKQVGDMNARVLQARQAVLAFRTRKAWLPTKHGRKSRRHHQSAGGPADRSANPPGCFAELSDANNSNVIELNQQIAAVEKQINWSRPADISRRQDVKQHRGRIPAPANECRVCPGRLQNRPRRAGKWAGSKLRVP